jgi:hypothetical protein
MSNPIRSEKHEIKATKELKPLNTVNNQNYITAVYRSSLNYVNYRNAKSALGLEFVFELHIVFI